MCNVNRKKLFKRSPPPNQALQSDKDKLSSSVIPHGEFLAY